MARRSGGPDPDERVYLNVRITRRAKCQLLSITQELGISYTAFFEAWGNLLSEGYRTPPEILERLATEARKIDAERRRSGRGSDT